MLFGSAFVFAVLKALYARSASVALQGTLTYGGLLAACVVLARGLLLRQGFAAAGGLVGLLVMLLAAATGFYIPETAQLPAGLLSVFGLCLLLPRWSEFAAPDPDDA